MMLDFEYVIHNQAVDNSYIDISIYILKYLWGKQNPFKPSNGKG